MKFGAGPVIRIGVLAIEGHARCNREFEPSLLVEPGHSDAGIECPTIEAEVVS